MPAKGGAFFGFAIIVAAALITWGIIALVEVADDDSSSDNNDSGSRSITSSELQVCASVVMVMIMIVCDKTTRPNMCMSQFVRYLAYLPFRLPRLA